MRWLRDRGDLACREVVELVTDHLEGALSRRDRRRLERHLSACGGCSAYLDQMRQTIRLTGRLRSEDVDPRILDELVDSFRDGRGS